MTDLRKLRKASGLTQFSASRKSGVNRMRLSLAETGQIRLRHEEDAALRRVLEQAIEARAARVQRLLTSTQSKAPEEQRAQEVRATA